MMMMMMDHDDDDIDHWQWIKMIVASTVRGSSTLLFALIHVDWQAELPVIWVTMHRSLQSD